MSTPLSSEADGARGAQRAESCCAISTMSDSSGGWPHASDTLVAASYKGCAACGEGQARTERGFF